MAEKKEDTMSSEFSNPQEPEGPMEDVRENVKAARPVEGPRPKPLDFSISLRAKGNIDRQLLDPDTESRQKMRGFEEKYVDIVDYIVRITHRIWEEKDIGYIYDTYSHNAKVYDDYGLQYGRDKIVADTVHTINAFPDIRLFADEIVWAGDDEEGFHTSHRTLITGHNTGYSKYGPPTGRKIVCWCMANCVVLANEIVDEWVIYDTSCLIQQLGFDLREKAREFGNLAALGTLESGFSSEPERLPGQGKPKYQTFKTGAFDPADFIQVMYQNIWNRRMLGTVQQVYAPNVRFHGPTNRAFSGRSAYQAFVLSFIAMFPDLAFSVDDVYWMGNEKEGYVTSVRWSLRGTHSGFGIYGPPTSRPVDMWGITQHRIKDGIIAEEWTLFNEFAVMQQVYRD